MSSLTGTVVALLLCLVLAWLAGVIVWFGVKGVRRRKGQRDRLHRPELAAIESKWGVKLPSSVERYFQSQAVDRAEFYLAPPGSPQSEWLEIANFLPLTCRDISDWESTTKVPGIPIALDFGKGVYYLSFEALRQSQSPVLLRVAERQDRKVASSFDEFTSFEPKDVPPEGQPRVTALLKWESAGPLIRTVHRSLHSRAGLNRTW